MKRYRPYFHCAARIIVASLAAWFCSRESAAQEIVAPAPRVQRVPDVGRSVASSDDSSALVINPANLSFMPGAELRWNWLRTGLDATAGARGHSFAAASSLPFGLASGVRLDLVRPSNRVQPPYDSYYSWMTWGLSYGSTKSSAGFSVSHVYADHPRVNGSTSLSIGWTGRPIQHLSLAAVAHDLNAPRSNAGDRLHRSFTAGAAVRPLGDPSLQLGVETRYFVDGNNWVPRGVLAIQVPHLGTVRSDVAVLHPTHKDSREYVATASVDVALPHATLSGGGVWGSALGGREGVGFVSGVSLRTWRDPGVPAPARAIRIRIDSTPGNRRHVALLNRLWAISKDPEVDAVVLHLKTEPASSLAHAYELGDALDLLKSRGKRVACHMEAEGARAIHVCAHADRVVINPAGGIRFSGIKSQHMYLGGLLTHLGVRAEFVRIGEFKSAPEQFTNQTASAPALLEYGENLREIDQELVYELARSRHIDPAAVRDAIASGPFTAPEALRARLVDGFAYDDELRRVVYELLDGRNISLDDDWTPPPDRAFGRRRGVAIVYLEGDMIDGNSRSIPLLNTRLAGSYTIAAALKMSREDPSVGAVVLRIESPGGSSMAADVIWREAELTARQKPLIVSMGTVAASGGYYAAAPGKLIFATPYTTTGSIGIFYGKADIAQLLGRIGINIETIRSAPRADAESVYRPFTEDERRVLGGKVKQFYDVFVDRVSRGRHMPPAEVDAVARGRVWMGRQALAHRLVDRIGGIRQALSEARSLAGVEDDAPIVELPVVQKSVLDLVADMAGIHAQADEIASVIPAPMVGILKPLAPFLVFDPDEPMALLEAADTP